MDYLIKPNSYGLFAEKKNGQAMIDSRTVAEVFGKEHRNVLRAIENLDCSPEFNKLNFEQVKYKAKNGQKQPCYNMTKDGFVFLVMGFTGAKAAEFKEKYIAAFNAMESHIRQFYAYREEYPEYTDAIKEHYEREGKTSRFAYSNEADMINKIVLGMTAKEFKKVNEIDEHVNSIRPYLEKKQIHMIHLLQSIDIAYLGMDIPYKARKEMLEAYAIGKGWNIGAKMIMEGDE